MATKKHCDVCDVTPAKDSHEQTVRVDAPNNMTTAVQVAISFHSTNRYGDPDDRHMELCDTCRSNALRAVLG